MPIYEFKCDGCGAIFEVLYRDADGAKSRCPDCGSEKCRRLMSRVVTRTSKPRTGEACNVRAG
jgi:putative FmdB family regulatory protein